MYATLKIIHVAAVALSAIGFVTRYVLIAMARLPQNFFARVVPHVVDSVLLASALGLLWLGRFNVLESGWLQAKIVALAVYIVAGSFALKRARTSAGRAIAFVVALGTFMWIVSVAVTKSPWGVLAGAFE